MNRELKLFEFSDGDEVWADYDLESAKQNFKSECGLTDEEVEGAREVDEWEYDIIKVDVSEDQDDSQLLTYREYLKTFNQPGYFCVSKNLV